MYFRQNLDINPINKKALGKRKGCKLIVLFENNQRSA